MAQVEAFDALKLCDRSSLLQGLKAMAELVEPIDAETLAIKIKR